MGGEFKDVGVVIKTADYKDADKIITILTRNHGLITTFALGARKQNSKKSPHLDLLSQVSFQVKGRDYFYLEQASTIKSFFKIKTDLKKISLCMSFFEILNHLVPSRVEDKELYTSLIIFLEKIEQTKEEKEQNQLSSKFARYLLRHLGYPEKPPQKIKNISTYFESLMSRKLIAKEIV